jgi:hypothetical protein
VTQVLLPAFCLPRRGYDVEVIGAALLAAADGAGYTRAAAVCTAPTSTVRDWVRAARRGAPALIGHAARLLRTAGDPAVAWPTPSPGPPLAAAMTALGAAARAVAAWLTRPDTITSPGHLSGIDYLRLLAHRHRHDLLHRLRVADPTGAAAHAPPWHLVTVITAGRLLSGVPG